ncbi:unnamed protein product [Mucor fragilis]
MTSYSRVMPNIKPYPQPQQQQQSMHYNQYSKPQQKLINLSVYRPAYHRIPSTPSISLRHQKDAAWAAMSPEVSPIIVPSMSPATLQPQFLNFYTGVYHQQPIVHRTYHHIPHPQPQVAPIEMNQVQPIHHTLENATITYDTIYHNLQKELVKDVFFSPAMNTDADVREMSPFGSFSSSLSASSGDNDSISSVATPPFSPYEQSPSEFLLEQQQQPDILFDFGLDLATTCATSNQTTTSSYQEIKMAAAGKPSLSLSAFGRNFSNNQNLPTPPATSSNDTDYNFQQQKNKRRCSDSELEERKKKKQRQTFLGQTTSAPHGSPCNEKVQKDETLFEQDASVEYSRFDGNVNSTSTAETDFQQFPDFNDDDSLSVISWEEEQELIKEIQVMPAIKSVTKQTTTKKTKKATNKKSSKSSKPTAEDILSVNGSFLPAVPPRSTAQPTIYQKLTKANVDWCRYCGTTEGVNWRPGPWGKRTLCNKHGCDYKGYGFACKLPRLDLTAFANESIDERDRPILQDYCSTCQRKDSWKGNVLVRCDGCPKAFHQNCCVNTILNDTFVDSNEAYFCDNSCYENASRKKIVVELPRKRLPLMSCPKGSLSSASSISSESSSGRKSSTK